MAKPKIDALRRNFEPKIYSKTNKTMNNEKKLKKYKNLEHGSTVVRCENRAQLDTLLAWARRIGKDYNPKFESLKCPVAIGVAGERLSFTHLTDRALYYMDFQEFLEKREAYKGLRRKIDANQITPEFRVPDDENFSFNTIRDFDEHIQRSIPSYDLLFEMILSISDYFIVDGQRIYDIGCSTGKLLKSIDAPNLKIGFDNSNLLPKSERDDLRFEEVDLNNRASYEILNACLVYSIFTLQFLEKDERFSVMKSAYTGLEKGGAFILAEKTYAESGFLQELLTFSYYDQKAKHFPYDEILSKERDLRRIMKPHTIDKNIDLLKTAGFTVIKQFWQAFNFVALIAIK